MIAGKFTCPNCQSHFELSTTSAPAQQSRPASRPAAGGDIQDEVERLLGEIRDAVMFGAQLEAKSMTFFRETQERFDQWRDKGGIKMSDKQMNFLRSVAARAGVD